MMETAPQPLRPQAFYTSQMLGLATELADYPALQNPQFTGHAKSPTCGSELTLGVDLGTEDRPERLGVSASACAVGQASIAIFARFALQSDVAAILAAGNGWAKWLRGSGPAPEMSRFEVLAPVRDLAARHGAVMLPWNAFATALCNRRAAS